MDEWHEKNPEGEPYWYPYSEWNGGQYRRCLGDPDQVKNGAALNLKLDKLELPLFPLPTGDKDRPLVSEGSLYSRSSMAKWQQCYNMWDRSKSRIYQTGSLYYRAKVAWVCRHMIPMLRMCILTYFRVHKMFFLLGCEALPPLRYLRMREMVTSAQALHSSVNQLAHLPRTHVLRRHQPRFCSIG